ncbi:MAG: histidine kinase dimerization/phosphoacceptor domain -containing protein [Gracilimonas sp.]|nr:histidine kinase dimerization/phosphoacceptor domain -containing protein [Gracilimonas sp.]
MDVSDLKYRLLLSVLVGALFSTGVVLLWYSNEQEQRKSRAKTVQDTGQLITKQFQNRVFESVETLQNLKRRIEVTDGGYFDYWEFDASLTIEQDPAFLLVEWIDRDMVIRRIEPEMGNKNAIGLDISELDYRRSDWEAARDDSLINLTHWLELVQGPNAFLVDAPVYYQNDFRGSITAALNFKDRFNAIMQGLDQYYVRLEDEFGKTFYEFGREQHYSDNGSFQNTISFNSGQINSGNWTITVISNHSSASNNAQSGLILNLILGLILSLITGFLMFYVLTANAARLNAKSANQKIRALIENSPMAIYSINRKGVITDFWNRAAEKLLGWKREEVLGRFLPHVSEETKAEFQDLMEQREIDGNIKNKEVVRTRKDGKDIYLRLNVGQMVMDSDNEKQMLVTLEDITREKEYQLRLENSLDEKEVLLAEVHHRVKNNLAIITGLIELQKAGIEDEGLNVILRETQNRIYSIASVHELLYNTDSFIQVSFEEYGEKLIERIREMFTSSGQKVEIIDRIETKEININQAIPLGLLMNELITNSFKHAFAGKEKGTIHIDVTEKDGIIEVEYRDDGAGFVLQKFEESKTLGVTLIKTLIEQLDAKFEIDTANGFRLKLRFQKNEKGSHSNL